MPRSLCGSFRARRTRRRSARLLGNPPVRSRIWRDVRERNLLERDEPCSNRRKFLCIEDTKARHSSRRLHCQVPLPVDRLRGLEDLGLRSNLSRRPSPISRRRASEYEPGELRVVVRTCRRWGEVRLDRATMPASRRIWGSELFYAPTDPGQDPRHVGTLEPVWNLLDLTPEGRPTDWDEQLSYP
jgi:hypothetical protein